MMIKTNSNISKLPIFSIAMVSAAALGYEILLMKLFSFMLWHHFAYMIISLALLGYGASGTFLALFQNKLLKNYPKSYIINLLLFAVFSLVSFLCAQQIPFNPLEIFFDFKQLFWLLLIYIIVTLPFFFAANAIGLSLSYFKYDISKIYRADMMGAGLGSLGIIILIYYFFPSYILQIICVFGFVSAIIALKELNLELKKMIPLFLLFCVLILALTSNLIKINPNQYKGLSQTLKVKGSEVIDELPSPYGIITVVKNETIPFRYAPGLSLASLNEPLSQLAVFTNGEGMSVITKFPDDLEKLSYLDYQTSALTYHLNKPQNVLIVGAGGGSDILQSLYHKTKKIDALELNPVMVDIVKNRYKDYSGGIYSLENVNIKTNEAREFIASTNEKYDLIQLSLIDSFGSSAVSLQSVSENYLYTVESIQNAFNRLSVNGYLSFTRWIKLPPTDTIKLFSTTLDALKNIGVKEPHKHIAIIRSWQTATMIVKRSPFTKSEIEKIKGFTKERFFDISYYHTMKQDEANLYNVLEKPFIYESIKAVLEDYEKFIKNYKFNLESPDDNKPYFYHNFKFETMEEILSLKDQGSLHLMEWGYIILFASFIQALIGSIVLIVLPLLYRYKQNVMGKKDILIYFCALGGGFLFLEIYSIQKFILFLGDPVITAAVVLSSFLIFAGLGSGYSNKIGSSQGFKTTVKYAVSMIILLGCIYLFTLDLVFAAFISQPDIIKIPLAIILIAPLAFAMGFPFPMGLSQLGKSQSELIPWAWGINGSASVISAVGASLISINFGFTSVIILALLLYITAYLSFPK